MDPASQMTLRLLMKTLVRIREDDLAHFETETLKQLLSILIQLGVMVSETLHQRKLRNQP